MYKNYFVYKNIIGYALRQVNTLLVNKIIILIINTNYYFNNL